jgi:predicted phage-related endonuclease
VNVVTIDKPADRTEWLAARHPYFNASDAGCLYGVHPHRNLGDVVADKLQPEATDNGQTEAMERGQRLEPLLLEWFGDRHHCKVVTPDVLYVNGRLMATIDGEIVDDSESWVEAKTTSLRWDTVPDHVYWQVVGQAASTGKRVCWVVWFDADLRLKQHKIVVPQEHVDDVTDRATRFMEFIDLGMAPEGVELRADHLAKMYPAPTAGHFAELDDDGLVAVVEWEQCRRARLAAEKAETAAKDRLANLIRDAEGGQYDGRLICTWRANKPTERVDHKALEVAHPEIVQSFRREVPGPRVLRATGQLGEVVEL